MWEDAVSQFEEATNVADLRARVPPGLQVWRREWCSRTGWTGTARRCKVMPMLISLL